MADTALRLTANEIREVVEVAVSAPSIHNTQPWRWRYDHDGLHLFADATRLLTVADPDSRQLLVSCGAALGFARLALRARGYDTTVAFGDELDRATPPVFHPSRTRASWLSSPGAV